MKTQRTGPALLSFAAAHVQHLLVLLTNWLWLSGELWSPAVRKAFVMGFWCKGEPWLWFGESLRRALQIRKHSVMIQLWKPLQQASSSETRRTAKFRVPLDGVTLSSHLFKLRPTFHGLIQYDALITGAERDHGPDAQVKYRKSKWLH